MGHSGANPVMHRHPRMTRIRFFVVAAALCVGFAACSSDGGSDAAPPSGDDSPRTVDSGGESGGTDEGTSGATGSGTGTLTMADGTVYRFETSTCDTSENDDAFLVEDGYDIFGKTADGAFHASFNRAGFDEETISEISTLEGQFDENGKNAELIYRDVTGTMALVVDGGHVSGTLTMKPIGSNDPHGAESEATVDITC